MYTAPYVTIVQRLGFGKSRILYQVAQKLAEPSAGLPESYAFDARLLFSRLELALEYASANWVQAKTDWLALFGTTEDTNTGGE
ncbi:hypothetical protein PC129_g23426 [Phytophthora cactorum]|nr:hypothetical protein PC113_g23329 [Phytophthora cactorum]KAG2883393.1 hypothetical protein PC117_g26034 [Phytophthora cactorum]KAG2958588.1 hypothetical protein PC118_g23449 [Phytophthora cactorum]KAG3201769.1 hypothetical protein PC129_g23426 [Phytophthora cactorum]